MKTVDRKLLCAGLLALAISAPAQDMADVQITAAKVGGNIYMLQGRGGNIGLFFGKNGVFLIDDQFAPLHEKITSKVKEVTSGFEIDDSKMFVINTHFHGDHTGGNELMGKAGAIIIAHENVRKRLSTEQVSKFFNSVTPPMAENGLPVITFTADLTFHLNGDSVNIVHMKAAHTDGDAIVHFTKANVIHTGDLVFIGRYPIIDLERGGSVSGIIAAARKIAAMCNADTKVIPGHGSLTDKAGLEKYIKMLSTIYERVKSLAAAGKSLDEVKAAKPTAEFDAELNNGVADERFIGVIYDDATKQ